MLYTGNVNRIIFWVLIPLIIISYLSFRVIIWFSPDDGRRSIIAEQHTLNLSALSDINCLILGGSNAAFSLSAKQMSESINLNCYNLSLMNEGFSDEAYLDFISSVPFNKTDITNIFYSTTIPMRPKNVRSRLLRNDNKTGISGDRDFQLLGKSIAMYFQRWLQNKVVFQSKQYPNPTSTGDFNFNEYEECDSTNIGIRGASLDVDAKLGDWMNGYISSIRSIFPNAQMYFVLPSTLRENVNERDLSIFSNMVRQEIVDKSVFFIQQSPFNNRSVLCDAANHTNAIGRELRTSELLKIIKDIE